jgi:ABC-type Fe3+-hydroxamate transport system substrate-binding protein
MRIVSLVPSVTETLSALERTPIAVTRFCERPDLLHVGGTKDPDVPAIVELAPDLVVVCDEENRKEDADALVSAGLRVHVVSIESVDDVPPAMDALATPVDVEAPSMSLPAALPVRLTAFVPIWRRPWMTMNASTYGSSVLERIGVRNVFVASDERYPEVTLEDAAAMKPDVVLAPTEPYPFTERFREELEAVAPVTFVDGQDLFWWGIRTQAALGRLLAQIESWPR